MAYEYLLSFYPKYVDLDEMVINNGFKKVNFFFDLKNNLQGTFLEGPMSELITESKNSHFLSSGIFSSVLSFLSFHKIWALKRNVDFRFHLFFESGESYYHINKLKSYKCNRKISKYQCLCLEDQEYFKRIFESNLNLIEKAATRLPKTTVIRLHNLEADFIPYYSVSRNLVNTDNETCNIIYSNDHDMFQCLELQNTFCFCRHGANKKIVTKGNALENLAKKKFDVSDEFLPFVMAIVGESGDDIPGVNGIAYKKCIKFLEKYMPKNLTMEQIYKDMEEEKNVFDRFSFDPKPTNVELEIVKSKDIIYRNLKLVSYELISRAVEKPFETEMLERNKHIQKCFYFRDMVAEEAKIETALSRVGVDLSGGELQILFS